MDYNEEEKLVEISIQLFTHDLVKVLEEKHKKKIDLEKTSEVNNLIFSYLEENLVLKSSNGENAKLKWIGKELTVDVIWVYVETPFTESLNRKTLQNTIFFETFEEQSNLVICKFKQKKADLLFKVGDRLKEIQFLGDAD